MPAIMLMQGNTEEAKINFERSYYEFNNSHPAILIIFESSSWTLFNQAVPLLCDRHMGVYLFL